MTTWYITHQVMNARKLSKSRGEAELLGNFFSINDEVSNTPCCHFQLTGLTLLKILSKYCQNRSQKLWP